MLFEALLRLSGLTPDDAAPFFGVRRRVVIGWMQPHSPPPPREALEKLYALIDRQEEEAERIIATWEQTGRPARFQGVLADSDEDARALGWPSVGAQATPAAIAQATLVHVDMRLVKDSPAEEPGDDGVADEDADEAF